MGKSGKGSSFEREGCRLLSKWWSDGARDDLFWRSAGSGGMAKNRKKAGKNTFGQYGDVQATDPAGQPLIDFFTIEFKRGYSSETFANVLDKMPRAAMQMWEKFIQQVMLDHKNAGSKSWMLIQKRDQRKIMIFIPLRTALSLIRQGARLVSVPYLQGTLELKSGRYIRVYIASLDDFLCEVDPDHILSALENENG